MFKGIVEEIGRVLSVQETGQEWELTISAFEVLEGTRPGDSIMVDGTCLTVDKIDEGKFVVRLAPGTLARTNLGELTPGRPVNLERPLRNELRNVSLLDVAAHRCRPRSLVCAQTTAQLPTKWGVFEAIAFEDKLGQQHLALRIGTDQTTLPLVRLHSECLTGDALGSTRCDCGGQLAESQRRIAAHGHGAVIYLRQEGRGIGLASKLRAYALQEKGLDTVEANQQLGLPADLRDYRVAAQILMKIGMQQVRLLTNNPEKVRGLWRHGIEVSGRVPLVIRPTANSARYLAAKRDRLGHLLPVELSYAPESGPQSIERGPQPPEL